MPRAYFSSLTSKNCRFCSRNLPSSFPLAFVDMLRRSNLLENEHRIYSLIRIAREHLAHPSCVRTALARAASNICARGANLFVFAFIAHSESRARAYVRRCYNLLTAADPDAVVRPICGAHKDKPKKVARQAVGKVAAAASKKRKAGDMLAASDEAQLVESSSGEDEYVRESDLAPRQAAPVGAGGGDERAADSDAAEDDVVFGALSD